MDIAVIIARVLHIGLGVFWVGALVYNAAFVIPSIRDAGPDGARVSAGLLKRRFTDILPAAAIVTIAAGLYLYWRTSAGFDPAYMGSPPGVAYGLGGGLAVVGFAVGMLAMRPAILRAAALGQQAANAAGPDRERMMAEAQALRGRAASVGIVVAWILGVATLLMAVARYL